MSRAYSTQKCNTFILRTAQAIRYNVFRPDGPLKIEVLTGLICIFKCLIKPRAVQDRYFPLGD